MRGWTSYRRISMLCWPSTHLGEHYNVLCHSESVGSCTLAGTGMVLPYHHRWSRQVDPRPVCQSIKEMLLVMLQAATAELKGGAAQLCGAVPQPAAAHRRKLAAARRQERAFGEPPLRQCADNCCLLVKT